MSDKIDQSKWQEEMDLSKATIFRLPAEAAKFLLACSIVCMGLLIFLLYEQAIQPHSGSIGLFALSSLILAFGAFYAFRSFLQFRDSIAVNDEGILYISRCAKSVYLPWDEVASIEVHDTLQRLVLRDASRQRKIWLEYQIENFSKLRELVISHATAVQKPYKTGQAVFHRSWYNKCILAAGVVFFLFLALHLPARQVGQQIISMGFAAYSFVLLFRDPTGLRITTHSVDILYLGWKQSIAFADVTGVVLNDITDSRGGVWAAVVIDRWNGKPIKLFRFRVGSIALRDALQSAWKAAGQKIRA